MAGKGKGKGKGAGNADEPATPPPPAGERQAADPGAERPADFSPPGEGGPTPERRGGRRSLPVMESRRRFLRVVGAGAVAAGAVGVWYSQKDRGGGHDHDHDHDHDGGPSDTPQRWARVPRPDPLVTFNPQQYDTLEAIAAVLLPADEDPGALETGAMVYVDRALGNPAFAAAARSMKVAVAAVNWKAGQLSQGKKFVELTGPEQEAVVQAVYQGEADREGASFKGRTFLTLFMGLLLEGHLSEPVHGGNKDGLGWGLVAFEPVDPRPGRPGHHH